MIQLNNTNIYVRQIQTHKWKYEIAQNHLYKYVRQIQTHSQKYNHTWFGAITKQKRKTIT